jgi:FlaA1/EpsC-like NDP-sugar epimerase
MNFRLRNRVFVAFDFLAWALIPIAALLLRLDELSTIGTFRTHLLTFAAVAAGCKFVALWYAGLYRRYWRYASVDEVLLITGAVLVAAMAAGAAYFLVTVPLLPGPRLPRAVPVLDGILTLLYVGGTRLAPRLVEHLGLKLQGRGLCEPVLIVGAGSAGTMIARELRVNPQLQLEPVGFIDDNPAKRGITIQGLQVIGTRENIPDLARLYSVRKVIIAMPTVPGSVIREIRDICDRAKLQAKIIPGVFEIISGQVNVSQLRDVQIEDLLRRNPVETDERAVAKLVNGATVLVTGAGGSIGSEICRQATRLGARELILLGHGENSIFELYHELKPQHHDTSFVPVIADVRDAARIRMMFEKYRPQVVFHAAAHKHVPLMELNPEEAVTNNVRGTANVVAAAEATGVSHFVLVSTDKAVNPGNVMGATKLLAERLVHQAAVRTGRAYVSVRFGNVLGSRGSAIPLFQKQIASGGPVTVTHPDISRYFMTIPEAVQLVLQAAALGKGGETFVLDMGDPVRIVDLAKDLVRLSGFEVDRDIRIVFTGLRPGEKLSEDLFGGGEETERTAHDTIFVVRNGGANGDSTHGIDELVAAAEAGDAGRLRMLLAELVPGFETNGTGKSNGASAPSKDGRVTGGVTA